MKNIEVFEQILKCDCDNKFTFSENRIVCEKCKKQYSYSDTYVNFFADEQKRPYWSMHMQSEFEKHGIVLNMAFKYDAFVKYYSTKSTAVEFFDRILGSGDIIVDLASGPSGYFGTLLKKINKKQFFIITDGSPMILDAHMDANKEKENIGYIDLDLDSPLPFQSNSIDCFMGNFLGNVMEYRQLIKEVYRALKCGGRYSVMEIFYEAGSEASLDLKNEDRLYADLDEYIQFCQSIGFNLESRHIIESIVGKLDPTDSIPRNDTDKSDIIALHFIKV